jgi:laminin beta 1
MTILIKFQLTLIPRIEVTTLVSMTGAEIDNIRREFEYYGCNQTYYDLNYDDHSRGRCKNILNMVSTYVFNGATRKLHKKF